ncbi:hypothetical protein S40288_10998 [Stachybotrys chartarum IBT 40288]|nr:hypothetical protein S40288_10998 [Stachybotrys chartarum IBT 40288]
MENYWMRNPIVIGKDEARAKYWVSDETLPHGEDGHVFFNTNTISDPVLRRMKIGGARVYVVQQDQPLTIPFHDACRELLCIYMSIKVKELDKKVLYESFHRFWGGSYNRLDLFDYGSIAPHMRRRWPCKRGTEYFMFNPHRVTNQGRELYVPTSIQDPDWPQEGDLTRPHTVFRADGDPFRRFAPQVLTLIFEQIDDVADLYALKQASPAFNNVKLGNAFWEPRTRAEMPWIWEAPNDEDHPVVWEFVYHQFHFWRDVNAKETKYGVINRERMWRELLPKWAKVYEETRAQLRSAERLGSDADGEDSSSGDGPSSNEESSSDEVESSTDGYDTSLDEEESSSDDEDDSFDEEDNSSDEGEISSNGLPLRLRDPETED